MTDPGVHEVVKTNIEIIQYLGGIKIVLGILGAICSVIIIVAGWAIFLTRWKTTVDKDLEVLKKQDCVSVGDCSIQCKACKEQLDSDVKQLQRQETISAKECKTHRDSFKEHVGLEFGHGVKRFRSIESKLDAMDKKSEDRNENINKILRDILFKMPG
ncbi:MAG: hypothetical protein OCC45_08420 [Desulfotalea sp.]